MAGALGWQGMVGRRDGEARGWSRGGGGRMRRRRWSDEKEEGVARSQSRARWVERTERWDRKAR